MRNFGELAPRFYMPDDDKGGDNKGDENKGEELPDAEIEKLLANPKIVKAMNAAADKRVNDAYKKWKKDEEIALTAEREKVQKDAKDNKLLEDGKLKELVEEREKEIGDLKGKIESFERRGKVDALLDKKGITDPDLRAQFHRMSGDLTELSEAIDLFQKKMKEVIDLEVTKRLGSGELPPKNKTEGGATKPEDLDTPAKKAEYIGKHGEVKFRELMTKRKKP
jgi:hypothetical protein